MSDYKRHKGILRPIEMTEELAVKILQEKDIEILEDCYENTIDQLMDECYDDYIQIGGQVFKLENHEKFGCDLDFSEVHKNEDGSYDFHALFYNGGVCLSEMLSYAMEELNEKA